ncbi:MAG: DUF721 domain-containing protein [Chitinophagales bacterium]|nr:DUF721 domain-containing protein [Chitinophagales bacterium]
MKHGNVQSLREAIDEVLNTYQLKERINAVSLEQNWELLFGKTIARYTRKIFISDHKLFLTIESAPLREELMYSKTKMIAIINERIAENFITEIIIR